MTRRALFIALALALAHGPAVAQNRSLNGEWAGDYVCHQGKTALELSVREGAGGEVYALFYFHADPSNPGVPDGCFSMRGHFDAATGAFRLKPKQWLLRPDGYVTIELNGAMDASGALAGKIETEGCDAFSLRRAAEATPRPAACAFAGQQVSSAKAR